MDKFALVLIVNTVKFQKRKKKLHLTFYSTLIQASWARQLSRYSDWLRAARSGDRIPVGARFSEPVQTGTGLHPISYAMFTGSFLGIKSGRGVALTPHPLLVALVMKE